MAYTYNSVKEGSLKSQAPPWYRQTFWSPHNRKILKSCGLIVVPMLACTATMLCLVFAYQISPADCPVPDLCSSYNHNETGLSKAYYTSISVGRLAFISSLSATFASLLIAVQMTLFSFVLAARLLRESETPVNSQASNSPYGTSLVVRLLSAEVPLLWDLGTRKIGSLIKNQAQNGQPLAVRLSLLMFLASFICSIYIQGANTYFHVVIQGVDVTLKSAEAGQQFQYSRALAPWCYDAGDTLNTTTNKYFWGCPLEFNPRNPTWNGTIGVSVTNTSFTKNIVRDYPLYMMNFTDADGVSYAIVKSPDVNGRSDWKGRSYAISTTCRAIESNQCDWTQTPTLINNEPYWEFNCSSARAGLVGNFTNFVHQTRLEDWHQHLWSKPPFNNRFAKGQRLSKDLLGIAQNATIEDAQKMFKNPFTYVSQVHLARGNEIKLADEFYKDKIIFQQHDKDSGFFLFACSSKVWDVEYTSIDGKIQHLAPKLSNGTVVGIVSAVASDFVAELTDILNRVYEEISRNVVPQTPAQFKTNYEMEMSKGLLATLGAFSIPVPVDQVQLRRNELVTRLPALALWLLLIGNALFAFLAIAITIYALRSGSKEVQQCQLRLSSAGLASQLFSPDTARQAARNEFDLFHERDPEEDTSAPTPVVEIHSSLPGGAMFVVVNRTPLEQRLPFAATVD